MATAALLLTACPSQGPISPIENRLILVTDLSGSRRIPAGFSEDFLKDLENLLESSLDAWELDHIRLDDPHSQINRISLPALPDPGTKWDRNFHQLQAAHQQALAERKGRIAQYLAKLPQGQAPLLKTADTYVLKTLRKLERSIQNDQRSSQTYLLIHSDLINHEPGQQPYVVQAEDWKNVSAYAAIYLLTETDLTAEKLEQLLPLQLDIETNFFKKIKPSSYVITSE